MSDSKTARTSLRSISRMYILNGYSFSSSFVLNHLTQLVEGPTMQTRTSSFICLDPFSNISQIFHYNRINPVLFRFLDYLFGNAMVNVFNVSSFFARDFSQFLLGRLRTVALKTLSHSQKFVPFSSKSASSEQFSCGGGSQNIFSKID